LRSPKRGIDFWLRPEIGHGKSQILVGSRVQGVLRFGQLLPSENLREYHTRTRINKTMSIKAKDNFNFSPYRQFKFVNVKSIK